MFGATEQPQGRRGRLSLLTVTVAVVAAEVRPFLLMAVTTKLQGPGARLVKVMRKGRAAVPSVCNSNGGWSHCCWATAVGSARPLAPCHAVQVAQQAQQEQH